MGNICNTNIPKGFINKTHEEILLVNRKSSRKRKYIEQACHRIECPDLSPSHTQNTPQHTQVYLSGIHQQENARTIILNYVPHITKIAKILQDC